MLRTRKTGNAQILFTLSGRIETEDAKQLQEILAVETDGQHLILDLKDVTLVNEDAVKFLCKCEDEGIKLENCPLHVRRWVDQVKDRPRRRRD
jgi:anti-anti-sigma regulatory factor